MNLAHQLDAACKRQGLSITGVSIGRPGDRQTWRIDYLPEATDEDRAAGQTLIDTYNPENDADFSQEQRRLRSSEAVGRQETRALVRLLARRFGVSPATIRQELRADHEAEQ
ncbi:MAG: hypothetical protein QGI10_00085 [Vicinamibacterales bacterium]|jgi:hypothetical protein|nr:hypothetical protein [Vicinamibacterales bacterium]MDP7477645.1 hypothetical protein [Vicinamibacterales bacterium]